MKLKRTRKYRHNLAVLLLLLYSCVSLPLHLWHSHVCDHKLHIVHKGEGSDKQFAEAGGHSCILCEHANTPFLLTGKATIYTSEICFAEFLTPQWLNLSRAFSPINNTRGSPSDLTELFS